MRTTTAATTTVASGDTEPLVYYDTLFRDIKGNTVRPPAFPAGVRFADTHAHLDMLHHPELALARCAAHHVEHVITVIDPTEDPSYTLENLNDWLKEAALLLSDARLLYDARLLHNTNAANLTGAENPESPTSPKTPKLSENCAPFFSERTEQKISPNVTLPTVRIIAGCHPHNAAKYDKNIEQVLVATLKDERTCGLGEIGLDYHYDFSPRDIQQKVYRRQLELAHELNLPAALHMREAHDDGLRILKEVGAPPAGTLLHCFNLNYATLEPFLELGCYVAFGGPLTFKKSDEIRDAALRTPRNRIITETDAPFMAPHPVRGVICGPEHVIFTAACLAGVFGIFAFGDNSGDGSEKDSEKDSDDPETEARAFYEKLFQNTLDFFERVSF